jgi:hypothetical protein
MKITYTRVGDYLLPNIILSEHPPSVEKPLGRYARIRQLILHEHFSIIYNTLLLSEKLFPHLREADKFAIQRRKCDESYEVNLTFEVYHKLT